LQVLPRQNEMAQRGRLRHMEGPIENKHFAVEDCVGQQMKELLVSVHLPWAEIGSHKCLRTDEHWALDLFRHRGLLFRARQRREQSRQRSTRYAIVSWIYEAVICEPTLTDVVIGKIIPHRIQAARPAHIRI